MLLAWTTVATREDADRLATLAIDSTLAVCVQVEGPITSHYCWQGKIERSEEFRLCFKLLDAYRETLEQRILAQHPYETPEWIIVRAVHVGEKYLSWANAGPNT